jgi:hypothetical protein
MGWWRRCGCSAEAEGLTPALPMMWSDVLILSPCPLLAATVALVAARFTGAGAIEEASATRLTA